MSDTNATPKSAPWHLYVVGVVSALWNSFGCTDYTMLKLHNAHWLAMGKVSPTMMAQIDAAPLWSTTGWALGVWASLAGSLLLLARSRFAPGAFVVSGVGAVVGFVWQWSAGLVPSLVLPVVIVAIVAVLWWYANRARANGWLR